MQEIQVSTANDFIAELLNRAMSYGSHSNELLYRGSNDAEEHTLLPAALRRPGKHLLGSLAKNVAGLTTGDRAPVPGGVLPEFIAIARFYRQSNQQGLPLPPLPARWHHLLLQGANFNGYSETLSAIQAWPPDDLLPLVALAQHHRIPTRLLDWTSDPLTAAYFAASTAFRELNASSEASHKRLAVWVVSAPGLAQTSRLEPMIGEDELSRRPCTIHIVDAPKSGNPNLAAQSGRFTLVRTPDPLNHNHHEPLDVSFDSVARYSKVGNCPQLRKIFDTMPNGSDDIMQKLTLPVSGSAQLLLALRNLGRAAESVFPGYDGAVEGIWEFSSIAEHLGMMEVSAR